MKTQKPKSAPAGRRLSTCRALRVRRSPSAAASAAAGIEDFKIPEPLKINQNEVCVALERAALSGGATGQAARELMKILQPHLLREEEDLLQILGLLRPLSQGRFEPAMRQVAARTRHLRSRMFDIMREHVQIIEAARKLIHTARAEHKLSLVDFTERLMLRAWTDEVVFYPAAILIGEYLRLKAAELARPLEVHRREAEL